MGKVREFSRFYAAVLTLTVCDGFAFLADLDEDEAAIAQSNPKDRALALRMLAELPGGRLDGIGLY